VTRYIIRRILWGVLLLILVTALMFVLFRILPTGDPARLRAGHHASPKVVADIRRDLGLDKSLPTQFWIYMKNVFLHFNLGYSYYSNAPVRGLIAERLGATLSLMVGGTAIWLAVGLPVGIVSALRRRSWLDRASMGTALVFVSAPEYWLGLIALYLFAADIGRVKIFPGAGSYVALTSDPWKWFTSMVLPWLVLAAGSAAIYARLMRGSLTETMQEALDIATLLGGAILVEVVFNIPGIGDLAYTAIRHSDLLVVQGTVLLGALFIVVANIVVDIAYAYLDPRVRYS
jgi:peptide/nickel transport system permease protein